MLVNIITHFVKVVVEVYIGSTEVAPKEGGVSREYGCHVNPEHSQQDKSHPCQPLVEVRYNQWSRTWDTFPELRGEEERGKEERGKEERGEEERGGLTRRLGAAFMSHTMLTLTPNFHWTSSYCRSSLGEIKFDISLST